eukprot:CAMPEP_0198225122 /NCGR_PEP_ID=MMETSP1445-20131203/99746_1 /TAXON_ID=36898 /ORGANISM="Pyramimonas sp., Strain CCMP2087" /LENGTH=47 /DNA_ID= /DNA_START= /DNA_END= /DNA_ORIENTATION=
MPSRLLFHVLAIAVTFCGRSNFLAESYTTSIPGLSSPEERVRVHTSD